MRQTHKNPMENNAFEGARMRFGRKKLNFTVLDVFFRSGMRIRSQKCILGSKMQKVASKNAAKALVFLALFASGRRSAQMDPKMRFGTRKSLFKSPGRQKVDLY